MAKVGIVMGSDSDMPVMSKAADILEKLGIDYDTLVSLTRDGVGGDVHLLADLEGADLQ